MMVLFPDQGGAAGLLTIYPDTGQRQEAIRAARMGYASGDHKATLKLENTKTRITQELVWHFTVEK